MRGDYIGHFPNLFDCCFLRKNCCSSTFFEDPSCTKCSKFAGPTAQGVLDPEQLVNQFLVLSNLALAKLLSHLALAKWRL